MTNKINSASQTVRAFNVGTLGDSCAWDDNLDAAPLEWLPAEEAPSFMSGTSSDEVCESGIGFAREREGCCMCSFGAPRKHEGSKCAPCCGRDRCGEILCRK